MVRLLLSRSIACFEISAECFVGAGLALWFDVSFPVPASSPPIILRTGPFDATTHWYQTVINFGSDYKVALDADSSGLPQQFKCAVELAVQPTAPRRYSLTVELRN